MVAESRLSVRTDSSAAGTEPVLQGHGPPNRSCAPRAGVLPESHLALTKRGAYLESSLTASEARAARPAVTAAGQGGGSADGGCVGGAHIDAGNSECWGGRMVLWLLRTQDPTL